MKTFNTTGTCLPAQHYMVDITERLEIIRTMVAKGDYFCVNRGRQYGKTTTFKGLKRHLEGHGYSVFYISLESLGDYYFEAEDRLGAAFLDSLCWCLRHGLVSHTTQEAVDELLRFKAQTGPSCPLLQLRQCLQTYASTSCQPVILLIDEVDMASNHLAFIRFLGMLRDMYLQRDEIRAFQSVILASVYDIKNLKLKMRPEEHHQYNSPWNIAVPFDVDMSLSAQGIADMLAEYKADHSLSFDHREVAQMIRDYTDGYPFLVSRICQIVDAERWTWDKQGVLQAVNRIVNEGNTLFDDIAKKLDEFPDLAKTIRGVLFNGDRYPFNYYDKATNLALMFSFVKQQDGVLAVACRLFEIWFYNFFIYQDKASSSFRQGMADKGQFIHDGIIDMPHLLERFVEHMGQTFDMDKDHKFLEENAREIFLTYLRPIINGIGNYYIEAQTRNNDRMDVIIDYLGQQYVIELKIWRGNAYNERGEEQLSRYLEYYNLQTGYLLSFCFNQKKTAGLLPPVKLNGRTLVEAIV